ncbi:unnamed protein product [Ilex paraguariensis]|uniref:Uncharacterized protein n=1 Tax=Ilex paraguariensis TaxID=185542 RepID=A0ABC8U3F3_9AQUA
MNYTQVWEDWNQQVRRQRDNVKLPAFGDPLKVSNFKDSPSLAFIVSKHDQDGFGSASMKSLRAFALFGAGVAELLNCATNAYSDEAEQGLKAPDYPWPYKGILKFVGVTRFTNKFVHNAIQCHLSLFVTLSVWHTLRKKQRCWLLRLKQLMGLMTRVPGELNDCFPPPYPNEQAARFANGGAILQIRVLSPR